MLDGEGYVFDDHRSSALAHRSDGGKHAGADLPQRRLLSRLVRERRRLLQLESFHLPSRRGTMAAAAACRLGNSSSPVYLTGRSGTVLSTASAMKASVPSEPTSTCWKISTGRSKSMNAFSE